MRLPILATTALLVLAGAASAETTVIRRDAPDAVAEPSSGSKSVTVHDHGDGCVSKTVRKENDLGDSKTVRKETCD